MSNPIEATQLELSLAVETKLYYDLQQSTAKRSPLLIALHGYGANKRQMMREATQIAPEGFAIASVQGPHQHIREAKEKGGPLRFGFGWLTNFKPEESIEIHHRALQDLVALLVQTEVADTSRIFLLGFSQSCAINYRFAFTYPQILRGVVGICGGIPSDLETSSLYKPTAASIFHLAGTRDDVYPPSRVNDYERRLGTMSDSCSFKSYDAAHEIIPEMRADVREWLSCHAA